MRLEPLIAEKFEMKGSEKSRQSLLDGHRWQRRRFWVELTVVLKIVLAVISGLILIRCDVQQYVDFPNVTMAVIYYDLADTITYLISLILMADVQKPSANIIRSIMLLLFNYVEVSLEMTSLYFCQYRSRNMTFLQALEPGLLGSMPEKAGLQMKLTGDFVLFYGNAALKFFFITMVFGYLAGHMRQRKFRS